MTEHPFELRLPCLWRPLLQALASVGRVGVPSLRPPFKLLIHAGWTQNTLVSHVVGYEHGGVQNGTTGAVLGSHPLVLNWITRQSLREVVATLDHLSDFVGRFKSLEDDVNRGLRAECPPLSYRGDGRWTFATRPICSAPPRLVRVCRRSSDTPPLLSCHESARSRVPSLYVRYCRRDFFQAHRPLACSIGCGTIWPTGALIIQRPGSRAMGKSGSGHRRLAIIDLASRGQPALRLA